VSSGWPPAEVGISAREAEVLAALAEHLTNAEIASRLFISIRTVESHVSSLLRKFQVGDRRALAAVAANLRTAPAASTASTASTLSSASSASSASADRIAPNALTASLPAFLTPFVGRVAERAALADALGTHRLVTAVGPGGVGKTRLALNVAAEMSERFADGVWYADLVPVGDPAMIAPAIAAELGVGEQRGRSAEDTILGWLAPRQALLVLDNCEHLLDGVVVLVERLLAGSPGLVVLATSRARLLVPFEFVFLVPGLSLPEDDEQSGDAVALFLGRASAAGAGPLAVEDRRRVTTICEGLDGMALAIELAAARLPALGLDGLEAGLADGLRLLTGGPRVDQRHRSLRSTLDWSYALLDVAEQTVLRRISVFAAPFPAEAATSALAGWPPLGEGGVAAGLATLADQSLLVAIPASGGTRYRALETIRQYGAERLDEAGETTEAHTRHLRWCLDVGTALGVDADDDAAWRTAFDDVADELRSALGWAAEQAARRADAPRMALLLGDLSFARGFPGESQRRYEQAAELAQDDGAEAVALRRAAGAAEARHFGDDALRLLRAAAAAAGRAGDRAGAARDLAQAAELINRGPGLMATRPPDGTVDALLAEAWEFAGDDLDAEARILTAEAFNGTETDPVTVELTERAVVLARRSGNVLTESAALDQLTAVQLARGEIRAAMSSALRRITLLSSMPITALTGLEHSDARAVAAECAVAAGDLDAARRLAEGVGDLPFLREERHLASARPLLVAVLAGDWDEAVTLAERFSEGWERAGRPRAGNLSRAAYAAATMYGLRGDDEARAAWLVTVDQLATPGRPLSEIHFGEFFDALLWLHRGQPEEALRGLSTPPESFRAWHNGLWRPWYAALWAEAAVLTAHPDAGARIHRARLATVDNPIAAAIVARAASLAQADADGLLAAAGALEAAGCRYQWARTLVLAGGAERITGEAALAAMGATAMVWPAADGRAHP
jgi:predicted ATPase/DNA-binding CsgD family transcriptional regulator